MGILASRTQPKVNQLERAENYSADPSILHRRNKASHSSVVVRQHDSHCLPKKPGDSLLRLSACSLKRDSRILFPSEHSFGTQASKRGPKRPGGPGLERPPNRDRVDLGLHNVHLGPSAADSAPRSRFVRHKRQRSTSDICFTLPRQSSSRLRCSDHRLESVEYNIPFSSSRHPPQNNSPPREFQGSRSSHSTSLRSLRSVSITEQDV